MTRNNKPRGEVIAAGVAVFVVVVVAVVVVVMAVVAFLSPNNKWSENFILSLLALGVGIPLLLFILPYISSGEVNLFGFGLKWLKEDIGTVKQRQLLNQVVTVTDDIYYWIDSSEIAHPLRDFATAQFLSQGKGIIRLSSDEWESIKGKPTEYMPPFRDATPKEHGRDKFILYNGTIYYQRSLAFLYKLADLQEVRREGKTKEGEIEEWEIEKWQTSGGKQWMQKLKPDDFKKYDFA